MYYFDYDLVVGHFESIDDIIRLLKNGLVVKVKDDLSNYCPVKFNSITRQEKYGWGIVIFLQVLKRFLGRIINI